MGKIIKKIIAWFKSLFTKKIEKIISTKYIKPSFPKNPRHYLNGLLMKNKLK